MSDRHKHFERLCALAASNELSEIEYKELALHQSACPRCRERMAEYRGIVNHLLLTQRTVDRSRIPAGMEERFRLRATGEGIPVSVRRLQCPSDWSGTAAMRFAAATLLFATVLLALRREPLRAAVPSIDMEPAPVGFAMRTGGEADPARPFPTATHFRRRNKAFHAGSSPQVEDDAQEEPGHRRDGFRPQRVAFDLYSAIPVIYEGSAVSTIVSITLPNLFAEHNLVAIDPMFGYDGRESESRFFPLVDKALPAFPFDVRLASLDTRFVHGNSEFVAPRRPLWFICPHVQRNSTLRSEEGNP
jgi:hypothetical protein